MSALPLVAIIGRANVGKSTLFNRLVQKRKAIVNNTPGVTRDRIYGQSDWLGHSFAVVDTGGVDVDGVNDIENQVVEQALLAQDEADVLIFVADKNLGLTPEDRKVVDRLRKSGKPFFFIVNKVDEVRHEHELADFSAMGMDAIYPVSAEHGYGVADRTTRGGRNHPPRKYCSRCYCRTPQCWQIIISQQIVGFVSMHCLRYSRYNSRCHRYDAQAGR